MDFSITATTDTNPFDVIATVTFVNTRTATKIKTEMFYNLNNEWKFRFTGTETGIWTFKTSSANSDLNNITGSVLVEPNKNSKAKGFVINNNGFWATSDNLNNVYAPQFAMYSSPLYFYQNESQIDDDIQTFLIDHGFDGFHIPGSAYWFDIESISSKEVIKIHGNNPNPDVRVFEALELLISKVHKIGKKVHIWLWGDETDSWTPVSLKGGLNGEADKRLLRYISARLGPLPGWTMEYGFDNWRWVTEPQVNDWYNYMHKHIDPGYSHLLGVRGGGNSSRDVNGKAQPDYEEQLNQLSEIMDYSSYEQHKPSYEMYVESKRRRPNKPAFSEDRFRIRKKLSKDYTMKDVRHGLYNSTMAGGVANIWGVQLKESPDPNRGRSEFKSEVFPEPERIKTYSRFFEKRFLHNYKIDNSFSNGYGLKTSDNSNSVVYKENTDSIWFDLTSIPNSVPVIAVDTKQPYKEIHFGYLTQNRYTWHTPYKSDWIIAIGLFDSLASNFPRDSTVVLDSLQNSNVVQISSFTVKRSQNKAIINLATKYENDLNKIEIQRSKDQIINWSSIYQINPTNKINGINNYKYIDTTISSKLNYFYRIKITLNNKNIIVSKLIKVMAIDSTLSNQIEVGKFTAEKKFSNIHVNLETVYEENLAEIELQRTENSKLNWITIIDFKPKNSFAIKNLYSFSDKLQETDKQYLYRARIVYKDGSFEFTGAINVAENPDKFLLLQNYPNPFNNSTVIEFSLSHDNEVNLSVYNLLGELIKTIYNKQLNAGYHKIEFNANNLPSGLYIYVLKTESFLERRKMLLLK